VDQLDLKVVDLARDLLMTTILVAAPALMIGLVVGITVSLFQALTSVQEQTMSLVPKMMAVMIVTLLLMAPALRILRDFTSRILDELNTFGLS
jgi:flagellar biosynthetic protein FliQ